MKELSELEDNVVNLLLEALLIALYTAPEVTKDELPDLTEVVTP